MKLAGCVFLQTMTVDYDDDFSVTTAHCPTTTTVGTRRATPQKTKKRGTAKSRANVMVKNGYFCFTLWKRSETFFCVIEFKMSL